MEGFTIYLISEKKTFLKTERNRLRNLSRIYISNHITQKRLFCNFAEPEIIFIYNCVILKSANHSEYLILFTRQKLSQKTDLKLS